MFCLSLKRFRWSWPAFLAMIALILLCTACSDEDTPLSNECKILSFTIEGAEVDMTYGSPVIVVPAGTDVSNLTPMIEISEGATISPASGVAQDFSKPEGVSYTVTAASKNISTSYTIQVRYRTGLKAFSLQFLNTKYEGVVDPVKGEIRVIVGFSNIRLYGQIGEELLTNVTLEDGFRMEPASGAPIDIDHPVIHTVYDDATGTMTNYKLVVINSDAMLKFVNLNIPGVESGLIRGVPAGTSLPEYTEDLAEWDFIFRVLTTDDISAVTLAVSDRNRPERATFVPALDEPQNFDQDITYTITAEAGNTWNMKVRVVQEKFISANSGDYRDAESYPQGEYSLQMSYRAISPVVGAKLIAESNNEEYGGTTDNQPGGSEGTMTLSFVPTNTIPVGYYKLHVTLQNGDSFLTKTRVHRW